MSGERHPSLHATALATGSGGFLLPATIADQQRIRCQFTFLAEK